MSEIDLLVVLDTETTGTEAETDSLLEVAWIALGRDGKYSWEPNCSYSTFVEFEGIIPATAKAVHHIDESEVAPGAPDCIPRPNVIHNFLAAEEPYLMYAAHNAPFDRGFLPELTQPWIDTYRCALHLVPDAPKHSNQVLRYHLGLKPDPLLVEGLAPHRALYDTAVTAELLRYLLREHTPEELLELSSKPVVLKECNFGKHAGTPWANVPRDYLQWMIRSGNFDGDKLFTAQHYLS